MRELPGVDAIKGDLDRNIGRYKGLLLNPDTKKWEGGLFPARRFQRKTWIFSGLITNNFITGMAIVDAGYIGTAFCYICDRVTGKFYEEKMELPLAFPDDFDTSLQIPWAIGTDSQRWGFTPIENQYKFSYNGKKISLEYTVSNNSNGVSTIAPAHERPFNFTYKNMNLPAKVSLGIDGKTVGWEEKCATIDFTKGFPPRETFWNWVSFSGVTEEGESIAINLVTEFNDGLENVLWIGGRIIPLGQAVFNYQKPVSSNTSVIYTEDGILDMKFYPEGKRSENLNLLFIKSEFIQAYGRFEGTMTLDQKKIKISGSGLVEEHLAVW